MIRKATVGQILTTSEVWEVLLAAQPEATQALVGAVLSVEAGLAGNALA